MKVWGIRHARIQVPAGVCYGRSDFPMADSFDGEVSAMKRELPENITEVWSSPSARCRLTAEGLGFAGLRIDPRLQELDFGEWEGREWESFRGPESDAWARAPWNLRPPRGESGIEMETRVRAVRDEILQQVKGSVLVVTHAGVLRIWMGLVAGETGPEVMARPVPYGTVWDLV